MVYRFHSLSPGPLLQRKNKQKGNGGNVTKLNLCFISYCFISLKKPTYLIIAELSTVWITPPSWVKKSIQHFSSKDMSEENECSQMVSLLLIHSESTSRSLVILLPWQLGVPNGFFLLLLYFLNEGTLLLLS